MSKAVLVMDMPKQCNECPCMKTLDNDAYCTKDMKNYRYIDFTGRLLGIDKPDWCPLISQTDDEIAWYDQGYMDGWGDCETQYKKWQIGGQQ